MSEVTTSGSATQTTVSDPQSGKGDDKVSYETYKRTVGEVKNLKTELEALRSEKADRENAVLVEQGKYKDALEAKIKAEADLKAKLTEKDKTFAKTIFNAEVKKLAVELGAMPEALEDIVKVGDWTPVQIDTDNYSVNRDQLKEALNKLQKDKPFYFKKGASNVRDVQSSASGGARNANGKTVDQMSKEELMEHIRSLGN
jgi:hypothetical protein